MTWWFAFFANFTIAALAIRLASPFALKVGLMDIPGGHKQHAEPVPLVGGISIYLSLFIAWLIMPIWGIGNINTLFMAGSGLLLVVGIFDDRFKLSVKLRFSMQIVAVLMMVYSNVVLIDLGAILSEDAFTLGVFAIPMTIFATIGVINAMNMMDGIDGLAGMVSLTILLLLLGVLYLTSGYGPQLLLIACLMGAIGGFLLFNLRWQGGDKAQVYLGDAGSTVLGFLFAWLFISMSQGEHRAMPPVTALWILAIPLIDTVGAMLRRMKQHTSPFTPDRFHLHHLLINAGFKVSHTVFIIAGMQLLLGTIGIIGLYLGFSERTMFIGFLGLTAIYIYKISRPYYSIPMFRAIHGKTGFIRDGVRSVYVGNLDINDAKTEVETLLGERFHDYTFEIYEGNRADSGENFAFAVIDAKHDSNVKRLITHVSKALGEKKEKKVQQFVLRDAANDERNNDLQSGFDIRTKDRRCSQVQRVYSSSKSDVQHMTG